MWGFLTRDERCPRLLEIWQESKTLYAMCTKSQMGLPSLPVFDASTVIIKKGHQNAGQMTRDHDLGLFPKLDMFHRKNEKQNRSES